MKVCSVTVDVDCLRSNFKGFGLRKNSYSFREFEIGIENLLAFFSCFNISATFFFVAQDLEIKNNADIIKSVIAEGHEIASHSYSHPQGFRLLSIEEKAYELKKSNQVAEQIIRPTGLLDPEVEVRPNKNQIQDTGAKIKVAMLRSW